MRTARETGHCYTRVSYAGSRRRRAWLVRYEGAIHSAAVSIADGDEHEARGVVEALGVVAGVGVPVFGEWDSVVGGC